MYTTQVLMTFLLSFRPKKEQKTQPRVNKILDKVKNNATGPYHNIFSNTNHNAAYTIQYNTNYFVKYKLSCFMKENRHFLVQHQGQPEQGRREADAHAELSPKQKWHQV